MHNVVYNLYIAMGEDLLFKFEEELAQDAVYNAPPVYAVYKPVHPWWRTMLHMMRGSAAADNGQHMTVHCLPCVAQFSAAAEAPVGSE